ncbi:MAG: hypothetical protein HY815_23250 [Candidatus Riflebacteria bacterium]|nr:hypothetical protein [Candidatus Riflebacteria bacterium]
MTLPNILVLQYLKKSGGANPEVLMKAEQFVRTGYQRLLTFEVAGGGFSWFGETPANVMLSAYGLVEFAEMAKVIPIDDQILPRTRAWLISRRLPDGHFEEQRSAHSLRTGDSRYALTAFVTWALLAAGARPAEVQPSLGYLLDGLAGESDPYALSLVLNALALVPERKSEAQRLARRLLDGRKAGWAPARCTLVSSSGQTGEVEVTSLATLGLIALSMEAGAIRDCVRWLLKAKDAAGLWGTTTSSVLALKALLADQCRQPIADPFKGTVKVTVNDRVAAEIPVSDRTYDVVQLVDLKEFTTIGDHRVSLTAELSAPQVFAVQLVSSYYLPWETPGASAAAPGPLSVKQTYDRTTLAVDDLMKARVELTSSGPASGSMVLLDLGIPPGFSVETGSLEPLVESRTISRFEPSGRQLTLYLPPLQPGRSVTFEYALRARFPIRAASPPSAGYEYYNPRIRCDIAPVGLEVR